MKTYNVATPEKYEKNGEEKTAWHQVGKMRIVPKDDGSNSIFITIPAIGLKAQAFLEEDKNDQN